MSEIHSRAVSSGIATPAQIINAVQEVVLTAALSLKVRFFVPDSGVVIGKYLNFVF
jgi:hypothetical protein